MRNVLLLLFPNQRAREPEPIPICWLEAFSKPTKKKKNKQTNKRKHQQQLRGSRWMARNRKRMQTKIRECSSFCTTKKRMAPKPYLNKKPRIIATSPPPPWSSASGIPRTWNWRSHSNTLETASSNSKYHQYKHGKKEWRSCCCYC